MASYNKGCVCKCHEDIDLDALLADDNLFKMDPVLGQAQCSTCKELEEKAKKLEVTVDRLRWRIDQLKREADTWRNAVSTAYSEVIAATRDQSAIKKIVNELEQKGFSVVACFSSENNLSAAAAAGQSIESGITIQRLPDGHS